MKQGVFTSDLVLNGTSINPKIKGELDITSIDIPFFDSAIHDVKLNFKNDKLYITSKGTVLTNDVNLYAVMKNKLTPPYIIEDFKLKLATLNVNKITDTMRDIEAEATRNPSYNISSNTVPPFDITQLIVNSKADESNFISNDMLKKFSKGTGSSVKSERKQVIKIESAKEDMEKLIGLDNIKTDLSKILNYIKLNKKRGNMPTLHMCFTGNPGTGKTSVARIIGKLFSEEKILSGGGEFVEVHGRDLVGQFVGWTAMQVHDIVKKALGGVLFIDEAYSLVNDRKDGFEDEAIATLIKEMEDHRDEICIILAGYTNEMNDLLEKNPGFKSRIQFTINFPDYSSEELYSIFLGLCKKEKYILNKNCKNMLIDNFEKAKKENDFGNGRYVRNLFEKIKFEQADRIIKTKCKNINLITKKDINNALLLENSSKITANKRIIGF